MRNKRIVLTIVAIVMTATICVFAFAGCQNTNANLSKALSPYFEDNAVSITNVELTGLNGYNLSSTRIYDEMVVATKYDSNSFTTEYMLYNAVTNQSIVKTNNTISKLSTLPVFCYTDASTDKNYFYGKDGLIISVDSELGGTYNGQFNDGRFLAEVDDEIIVVTPTLELSAANFTNLIKSGNYFYAVRSKNIIVFNADKTFAYSKNISSIINNYDYAVTTLSNGYVLIQTEYELSENEALRDFSYYDDGKYFKLNTFVYDLKAQSYKQIDFNAVVDSDNCISLESTDSTTLYVTEINADKRLANQKVYIVDHNLNKIIDFDSYMSNIVSFNVLSENEVLLTDGYMINYYNNNKLVASYPANKLDIYSCLLKAGNDYYNFSGEKVFTLESSMIDASALGSSNGIIYYSKITSEDVCFYAYNSKTASTTNLGVVENVEGTNVFVKLASVEDDTITAAYNAYDCSAIFTGKSYTRVSRISYGTYNYTYTYLAAYDANGNVTYYLSYVA